MQVKKEARPGCRRCNPLSDHLDLAVLQTVDAADHFEFVALDGGGKIDGITPKDLIGKPITPAYKENEEIVHVKQILADRCVRCHKPGGNKGDMPLKRIDEICRVLKCDFSELARKVADLELLRDELTLEQEHAVVADKRLLVMALCALSQWPYEQIMGMYAFTDAEAVRHLTQLDRLGIVEIPVEQRAQPAVAQPVDCRPDGIGREAVRFIRASMSRSK